MLALSLTYIYLYYHTLGPRPQRGSIENAQDAEVEEVVAYEWLWQTTWLLSTREEWVTNFTADRISLIRFNLMWRTLRRYRLEGRHR